MTTFYLIRHAERDTPADLIPGRTSGVRLTDRGRRQAEAIARRLAGVRIDQIYSSPLERAVETAAPLARDKQLPVELTTELNEGDLGAWTGKRLSDLAADPHWRLFHQFRSGTRAPDGESRYQIQFRVVTELIRLRDGHPDQSIACFSHADPIRFALVYFLGMPLELYERFEIGIGSISTLTLTDWGARVDGLNEIPPL